MTVIRGASDPRDPTSTGIGLTSSDWQRIFALLDDALDLPSSAVPTWLATLDPSAGRYAGELKKLLDDRTAIDQGSFMRTPAHLRSIQGATGGTTTDGPVADDETRVGPYRLLEKIGRGGTATVWLAERADGLLNRKVALKRPDVNFHGAGHAMRLARERDILASLTHSNIARIYDAGVEKDGRPYLAMEYVDGLAIDVFARKNALSTERRVGLLIEVARAVAYAHSQLVVHRDLKPSNILVDVHGRSHLVDFGIAKLLDATVSTVAVVDDVHHTIAMGRALTPHYASPEQLRGDAIGVASDVYSLGIVSFELLTGVRPYRLAPDLGAVALAESVARSHIPRASSVVADRSLRRTLSGDLDAVLCRMLEKRPGDRYSTIDAVADDLERYLRREPVRVRGSARLYLARSWLRRHPIETTVAVAIVLALIGGDYAQLAVGLALGFGAVVALWQRNKALQQAERAKLALERSDQVKNFIVSILTQAVPGAGRAGGVAATDLLKVAARRLEADLVGQPAVAAELAAVIGEGFNELGDLEAGRDWLPKAVELCDREFGPRHVLTLRARRRLVEAANNGGDLRTSAALLPALLQDLRDAQPPQPRLLVQSLQSHAYVLTKQDRPTEAFAALDEAVAVAARQLGEEDKATLTARASLSNTCIHFGRAQDALLAIEPALAPAYAAFGDKRPDLVLMTVERNYADALTWNQRPRDATAILRQTLADQIALDGPATPRGRYALLMLARALLCRGCASEPVALLTRAVVLGDPTTHVGITHDAVNMVRWLAYAEIEAGDPEAALSRLVAIEAARGEANVEVDGAFLVVRALCDERLGRGAEAVTILDAAAAQIAREPLTWRLRARRIRSSVARRGGDAPSALRIALAALAEVDGGVAAIEQGWLAVEAARASRAAGDAAGAAGLWRRALATWEDGQVDGRELHDALRDEIDAALGHSTAHA